MKKILMIAIAAIAFAACGKDDNKGPGNGTSGLEDTPIGAGYFTVNNASYSADAMPAATTDDEFVGVNMNGSVLNGGSSIVTVESDVALSEFFVAVDGVEGHYTFDAHQVTASRAEGVYVYQFTMLISQELDDEFTVRISARNADGYVMPEYTHEFDLIEAGTGALQINLSFNRDKDLDLHLLLPDGSVIDYNHDGKWDYVTDEQLFGLDVDSNPSCSIDGINSENIFFPEEYVMNGKYTHRYKAARADSATSTGLTGSRAAPFTFPVFS